MAKAKPRCDPTPLWRGESRGASMAGFGSSRRLAVLVLPLLVLFVGPSAEEENSVLRDVGLDNPIIQFAPSSLVGSSCERIHVTSLSRLKLGSYASSLHVSLMVSEAIPERLREKIEVCFHRNASIGLCECKKDEWQVLKKGKWSAVMSPYETRFIDVNFKDKIYGTLTASVEEEFQNWRLICLGFGFFLLIIAPIVSHWVPFYYSTSMALGILLVVLIILFQGMKLLPMGRKNVFYLTIYGSVLGVGSFIAHYFSTIVNSILVSFGLNEEMHNPVSVFLLVGIFLAGASLGYWIVRKFILSDDGNVDAGIAQFVRWAMRVVAVVSIFQSTLDPLLALAASALCFGSCFALSFIKWRHPLARKQLTHQKDKNLWQQRAGHASAGFRQAQFFSRSAERGTEKLGWRNPSTPGAERTGSRNLTGPYLKSNSPTEGLMYSSPAKISQRQDYYSTFHKIPRRRFSKREWEDFTSESTKEALSEWAASPEVSKWFADNAHRMRLDPDNNSDDESMASSSGSSEETAVEDDTGYNIWKWY